MKIRNEFRTLPEGAPVGPLGRALAKTILETPVGDWQALFAQARRAEELDRNDRLYALQAYAQICADWRSAGPRDAYGADAARRKATRPRAEADRAYRLRRSFGITIAEYDAILEEQGGVCAICRRPPVAGKHLAVDHDHKTGLVRGLLCYGCNRFYIGRRRDPARFARAAEYLADPPAQRVLSRLR